jgi:PAS domain S-box-containing protein
LLVPGILMSGEQMGGDEEAGGRTSDRLGPRGGRELEWVGPFWLGFEAAPFGLALLDMGWRFVDLNQALANLLGRPKRDLVGADARAVLGDAVLATPGEVQEVRLHRDAGPAPWLNLAAAVVPDEEGNPVGLFLIVHDVTDRRRMEEALRESEERFRLLVEGVEDYAIFLLDPSGAVATWNPGAERIQGYRAQEIIGRHFSCFYPADERDTTPHELLRRAEVEGSVRVEGWRQRKDGTRFWADVTIGTLRVDGELRGFAKVTRDMTQRRVLEEQLRQAQKMEAVGRLAGGVAHDFNNVLAAIIGYCDLLRRKFGQRGDPLDEVEQIARAADRARDVVAQLLTFSRAGAGEPETVNINDVVSGMEAMLRRLISDGAILRFQLAPDAGAVTCRATQLEQVLLNLVLNAQDAIPEGGTITVSTGSVEFAPRSVPTSDVTPGQYGSLTVTDTGFCMDSETQARMFDPFFTTKDVGGGTGLGLSTVYGIVAAAGGHVLVRSSPGLGSTFDVLLPHAEQEAATPAPSAPRPQPRPGGQEVVLLVEDEEPVRSMLQLILDRSGYAVLEAADGVEALAVADGRLDDLDLVVTDVAMPRLGGRELVAKLRQRRPDLPVLFISGYTPDPLDEDAQTRFLQKPFTLDDLLGATQTLLNVPRLKH